MKISIDPPQVTATYDGEGDEYAFYLYVDGEVYERTPYASSPTITFDAPDASLIQVKAFARTQGGEKFREWSPAVTLTTTKLDPVKESTETAESTEVANEEILHHHQTSFGNLSTREVDQIFESMKTLVPPAAHGWFVINPKSYSASRIINQGWGLGSFDPIDPLELEDWGHAGRQNRSWGFHLNAWEFMDPVLQEFERTRDEHLLRWMQQVAENWWRYATQEPDESAMLWYDMSLSLRAARVGRLALTVARESPEFDRSMWLQFVARHQYELFRKQAFNLNNNHGFFAAAASIDFSRTLPMLPHMNELESLGQRRMSIMVDRQFGADGGHLEHSPDYHRMLLASFESALTEGLIDDDETKEKIRKASYAYGWMVQPNGTQVQFGDSPSFDVDEHELHSVDERAEFLLTDGKRGTPDKAEHLFLPDAGYAFIRSPQPNEPHERIKSSYLAFQGGFHSRAHKHADDLTFTWFDFGVEILVDAGRFGYVDLLPKDSPDRDRGFYYSAPERQYVESTLAHNTVSVGGQDIERRKRTPYGNAILDVQRVGDSFIVLGRVNHDTYEHKRSLLLDPSKALRVTDEISIQSGPTSVVSWFNVEGSHEIVALNDAQIVIKLSQGAGEIEVRSTGSLVAPVRGQAKPLRGWRSRHDGSLEPTWSFGFSGSGGTHQEIATEFVFREGTKSQ